MENADNPQEPIPDIPTPVVLTATDHSEAARIEQEAPVDVPPIDVPPPPKFVPTQAPVRPTDPKEKARAANRATRIRDKLRAGKDVSPVDRDWLIAYDGGERQYYPGGDLRKQTDRPHIPPLNVPPKVGSEQKAESVNAEVMPKISPEKAQMAKGAAAKYGAYLKEVNQKAQEVAKLAGHNSWPTVPDWIIDGIAVPAVEKYLLASPILDQILSQVEDEQSQLAVIIGTAACSGVSYGAAKFALTRAQKAKKQERAPERQNVIAPPVEEKKEESTPTPDKKAMRVY